MPLREPGQLPLYPNAPSRNTFEDGNDFADFAAEALWREGLAVTPFMSKRNQIDRGESLQGFEFKLDRGLLKSGRLAVEVAERGRCQSGGPWVWSGVLRNDNTRFYVHGNQDLLFCFSVKTLVHFYAARGEECTWCACHRTQGDVRGKYGTVSRFWLSLTDAYTYSIFWLDFRPKTPAIHLVAPDDDLPF